jgi:hypothetical protein
MNRLANLTGYRRDGEKQGSASPKVIASMWRGPADAYTSIAVGLSMKRLISEISSAPSAPLTAR